MTVIVADRIRFESSSFRNGGHEPPRADAGAPREGRRHRTAPLEGLWTHGKAGYFHGGCFATLVDVVDPMKVGSAPGSPIARSVT